MTNDKNIFRMLGNVINMLIWNDSRASMMHCDVLIDSISKKDILK